MRQRKSVWEKETELECLTQTVLLDNSSDEKKLSQPMTSICVLLIILVSTRNKRKIASENGMELQIEWEK